MAYDVQATERYIREAARKRGIDPDTAVRVARSEGLGAGIWQSGLSKGGQREPSFGPFQLLVGGEGTNYPAGMGNDFKRRTGLDPSDPSNVNATIDFAMDHASQNGWGAWYGAAKAGVGKRDGIGGQGASSPLVSAVAERQAPRGAAAAVNDMGVGGQGHRLSFPPAARSASGQPAGPQAPGQQEAGPVVNIGMKPQRDTKQYDSMLQRAMTQGSQSQNPWDVVGSLAQVYAASSEKREAEGENASELQKVMAAAGLDPSFAMMAQLGGDRESAAQAIGAQQQFRAQTAQREEARADRMDERDYQRGRDTVEDQRVAAALERGTVPAGYRRTETGMEPIPGGPADPSRANADFKPNLQTIYDDEGREQKGYFGRDGAWTPMGGQKAPSGGGGVTVLPDGTVQVGGSGMKLTEGQSKDLNYYTRGAAALPTIEQNEEALGSTVQRGLDRLPGVGNFMTSDAYQTGNQAGREFLASILRKDTGAAITSQEFDIYGPMFLPQPGDGADVLAQKRAARTRALQAMKTGLGTATPLTTLPVTQNPGTPSGAHAVPAAGGTAGGSIRSKYGLE